MINNTIARKNLCKELTDIYLIDYMSGEYNYQLEFSTSNSMGRISNIPFFSIVLNIHIPNGYDIDGIEIQSIVDSLLINNHVYSCFKFLEIKGIIVSTPQMKKGICFSIK